MASRSVRSGIGPGAYRPREREDRVMTREEVVVERRGDVAVIVLNRPEVRNAVNAAMARAIVDAVVACKDAGAIVLTGADPAFCAGLDLRDLGVDDMGELAPFVAAVDESEVPVVAAVNGPAVTGGFELALACDFIVASERAAFADTHVRVGVYPGPVAVDLPRRVGIAMAREMSLTGNFVDAATALRIGLANHVVPHEQVVDVAVELATAIAEQDREMVRLLRQDWTQTADAPLADARRIHMEFARHSPTTSSGAGIAQRRDAVLERSRVQRGTSGPDDDFLLRGREIGR
ncbi:MAG: enoyl-CoA hydratase [Actinobacteria bacterium]|nr:MAG: enoyl-CoA hydratase [Actinomycetota bacterium]